MASRVQLSLKINSSGTGERKVSRSGGGGGSIMIPTLISFCTKNQSWKSMLGMHKQEVTGCFSQGGKGEPRAHHGRVRL